MNLDSAQTRCLQKRLRQERHILCGNWILTAVASVSCLWRKKLHVMFPSHLTICEEYSIIFGASPTQLEQGWLDFLPSVPCRCWRFAGMEQPLPAEHNSKRMFLRLLWNPFEVASLCSSCSLPRDKTPARVKELHSMSLCTLVLELACACSVASSACATGENMRSSFLVYGDGSQNYHKRNFLGYAFKR